MRAWMRGWRVVHWALLLAMTGGSGMSVAARAEKDVESADVAAIRKVIADFVAAYNRGDVNGLLEVYSAELADMREGLATTQGPEAIESRRRYLEQVFAEYRGHLVVQVDEIKVYGDVAFDHGLVKATLTPRSGGEVKLLRRRFLEILKKEPDGKWRAVCVMTNVDNT